ncbi:YqzL family protein [Paenibacillus sp. GSMTC-2017]|uniref:YqzL family protein n=1 Tax=Paenibacillus sp. GSMTC-2017 TaxID=2794350 RepID=UPI0018D5EF1B|nr:YqzL family protein [Paenibacillus sp. GSMTC-2017]MBH5318124.1 YqzL family protein [Paenibacillus sp. GSMTC-2017]
MRDFSWKYFTLTGDVESFMLYKEMDQSGLTPSTDALDKQDDEHVMLDDLE